MSLLAHAARNGTAPGILIASASTASVQLRAAEALHAALKEQNPGLPVRHVDVLELAAGLRTWQSSAERILAGRFQAVLRSRPWRVVLCTHVLPCRLAAGVVPIPFALVVPEFTPDASWLQREVCRYFVATPGAAEQIRARLPDVRIDATGIPIHPNFLRGPLQRAAREELGLEADRRTVLVLGGGPRAVIMESVRALLQRGPGDLQILALCEAGELPATRLAAPSAPHRQAGPGASDSAPVLKVFADADRTNVLMAAADIVVTDLADQTCGEALALGRPLILTGVDSAGEHARARTLVGAGVALAAPAPCDVPGAVELAFRHGGRLAAMRDAAGSLGRPYAATAIALAVGREFLRAEVA